MASCAVRRRDHSGRRRVYIASGRRGDHVGCSREDGHSVGCLGDVGRGVGVGRNPGQFACIAKFATSAEFDRMAEFGAGIDKANEWSETLDQLDGTISTGESRPCGCREGLGPVLVG